MIWLKKNKIELGIFLFLLIVNFLIFVSIIFTQEQDFQIGRIVSKEVNGLFEYTIDLKGTKAAPPDSELTLIYSDGSREVIPDVLSKTGDTLKVTSPKKLEHLSLIGSKNLVEKTLQNNERYLSLWSQDFKFATSISLPDYDYFVDQAGRMWFLSSTRPTAEGKPAVSLLVLDSDGSILMEHKQISPKGIYSGHPVIRELADGKIHILWSSYIEDRDVLFHTAFTSLDGKIVQDETAQITEENTSLTVPAFLANEPGSSIVVVQTYFNDQVGFNLYDITAEGVKKVASVFDQNNPLPFGYASSISKMHVFRTTDGNYLIAAAVQDSEVHEFYVGKFSADGRILTPLKFVSNVLTSNVAVCFNAILNGNSLTLFWAEENNVHLRFNQICYMVLGEDGQILIPEIALIGPDSARIQDLSVYLDKAGNYNLVWSDERVSKPSRPNRDLVYMQLNNYFEVTIPEQVLTNNLADQMTPLFKEFDNYRHLAWFELKDGIYHVYYKNNNPTFIAAMAEQNKWDNTLGSIFGFIAKFIFSIGAQLLFLFPLSLLPLIGILIVLYLFSSHTIEDSWLNWASIFLGILFLKFLNLSLLSKTQILVLADCYKVSLVTFLAAVALFYAIYLGLKNWHINPMKKSIFLVGWVTTDTFLLTLLYYLLVI